MRISTSWLPGGRWRWLAAGGVTAVAGALVVVLLVRSPPSAACAAPPAGGTQRGKATFYTLTGGGGNCSYDGPPGNGLFAAVGPARYAGAAACGGHLDVTGPDGAVRVKVIDQCPECTPGHLDLSAAAFKKIADPVRGVVPVTFRVVVNPAVPDPLTFRVKEGASRYWFAVRVDNTGNPLASVRARTAGGPLRALTRTDYNYWLFDSGLGPGPFTISVTDVYGNTATASGVTLRPGVTQRSGVRLFGAAGTAGRRTGGTTPARTAAARPVATTAPAATTPSSSLDAPTAATVAASTTPPAAAAEACGG